MERVMLKYFKRIKQPSRMFEAYMLMIQQPEHLWEEYFNFRAIQVPHKIWSREPLFAFLGANYNFRVGIVKMLPEHFYQWHVDSKRKVSINMLLTGKDTSYCVFKDHDEVNGPVTRLPYVANSMYLFNTQEEHCVFNGRGERFLLTVEFDNGETYETLMKELKGEWI